MSVFCPRSDRGAEGVEEYLIEEGGMEQPGSDANEEESELGGNKPWMMLLLDDTPEAKEREGHCTRDM